MCPRESFKAFMEVVRDRCLPWEEVHLKAARDLQDLLRKWMEHRERVETERKLKVRGAGDGRDGEPATS